MIRRILLKNFLAHKRTEIEFARGVTVLTGPNNSGKSAVVEALRCLASNPKPHFYIRHGAKKASVEVELENGATVKWARKKTGGAVYTITRPGEEPQVYAKFGRRPPEDVLDLLKLDFVALEGGDEIDVHIGDQRRPIFMLDQSGWSVANFFAASTESAHLLAMQRALKDRIQEARVRERDGLADMAEAERDLDAFAPLPGLALELERAEVLAGKVRVLEGDIPALERIRDRLAHLAQRERGQRTRSETLASLAEPPALWPAQELARRMDMLRSLAARANARQAKATALAPLAEPPEVFDTARLEALRRSLKRAGKRLAETEATAASLRPLAGPPELFPARTLARAMDAAKGLAARATALERKNTVLAEAKGPPELFDPAPGAGLLARIVRARQARERLEAKLAGAEQEIENFKAHVAGRSRDIGACPTCGALLDPDLLLEKGHGHG